MRRAFLITAAAVLVLFSAGCGQSIIDQDAVSEGPPVKAVKVATVEYGDMAVSVEVDARLAAPVEVNVAPKVGGKVAEVLVDVGNRVTKGQTMARLETKELEVAVSQAEAGLMAAQANLNRTRAGTAPQVEQAEAAVRQAELRAEEAETNRNRMKTLFEEGAISRQQWEQVDMAYYLAREGLTQAKEQLNSLKNGSLEEGIKALEAQVEQAGAGLEAARFRLVDATIKAPLTGVVISRQVESGEMASPGMPVLVVAQLHPMLAEASVTESQIRYFAVGKEAHVTVKALDKEKTGRVQSVAPTADVRTRSFLVKIEVNNEDRELRSGMSAQVSVKGEGREGVLLVPWEALVKKGERQVVLVVKEDRMVVEREVSVGLTGDKRVEVTAGLSAGEQVVISGQQGLRNGDAVLVQVGGPGK